jgi:hypothetical protein
LRFENAFEFGEGFFEAAGVVVIGEALDDQIGFAGGDAVPGAVDARDEIVSPSLEASKSNVARSEERFTTAFARRPISSGCVPQWRRSWHRSCR